MAKRPVVLITQDQKIFRHANLSLERFAESLFGKKYHKSADRVDIGFWKAFYLAAFEVLDRSIFSSIGSIDKSHKQAIQQELTHGLESMRRSKTKDELHGTLIVTLLKLVFLLLGRLPYQARGKRRSFATFRTLTYSQTEEQLSPDYAHLSVLVRMNLSCLAFCRLKACDSAAWSKRASGLVCG